MSRKVPLAGLLLVLSCVPALAQQSRPAAAGGMVKSMGQPQRIKLHASAVAGGSFQDRRALTGYASVGVFREFLHPAWSLFGANAEMYLGVRGERGDGGARATFHSPYFRFGAGYDYNFLDQHGDPIITFLMPMRRGGILGNGSTMRVEWFPTRDHSFNVGLTFPLFQPWAGKTRPRRDAVHFPDPQSEPLPHDPWSPALAEALGNIRSSADWITRLTIPYLDHNARTNDGAMRKATDAIHELKSHLASTDPRFPDGRTSEAEVRAYHAELDRAFSIAASGTGHPLGESTAEGREIAGLARDVLLEEIILPYDRLLGRRKEGDSARYFAVFARGAFARRLATERQLPPDRALDVQYVFQEITEAIEAARRTSQEEWDDSRLTWIPFQLALLPEDHDTQRELDALIERAVQQRFSEGNHVWYVINESFQWEVRQMILDAEDYHVLWIHDFRGVDGEGDPDEIAASLVVEGYLAALTNRVRAYDRTGKIPVFLIIQDQFYYENNKSRRWLDVLEDPMRAELDLPKGFEEMEAGVAAAQEALREAVRDSDLLQAEAREYGAAWLRNRIKVHVNITNPSDPTFRSRQVVPIFGILDNVIRDHRKISFYDVTEEAPYRGRAIFAGMGIGEHYAGPTWEDRALLVEGPALIQLKQACRQVLLDQSFEPDEIPHPLRPRPYAPDYDERVLAERARGPTARGLQVHNATGYRDKPISVYKAMMYTLMPPGSVMITPDFVWHSPYWASMLVGASLRGCRSFVILPSLPNQPSPGFPPMARSYEMFERLIAVQDLMGDEFAAVGGMLKTGFFDPDMDVKDIRARIHRFRDRFEEHAFLRELINPHPTAYQALQDIDRVLDEHGFHVTHVVEDAVVRRPQLHLKAQFFASREAWRSLLGEPIMRDVLNTYCVERARQLQAERVKPTHLQTTLNGVARDSFTEKIDSLPPEIGDRIIWYLSVGSQNQDYRGMFLDGEVTFVTAGWEVVWGLMDFVWILGMCDWVTDVEGIERHLSTYSEFQRYIGRMATILM